MLQSTLLSQTSSEPGSPVKSFNNSTKMFLHYSDKKSLSNQCLFYFLFVNPKSGDKQGKDYLTVGQRTIQFKFGKQKQVAIIRVYNLFDSHAQQGFRKIKEMTDILDIDNLSVRIIVCGGDGTINWVLSSTIQNGIDLQKVSFGILPIGTGNDFSRSLGWGYKTISFSKKNLEALRRIVKLWNQSKEDYYDIWDIEIKTNKKGYFCDIKNQEERKIEKTVLKRSFTNYVGLGLDARIVYQVEKSRGRNAFFNRLLYSFIGTLNYCQHLRPIDQYIYNFQECQSKNQKCFAQQELMLQKEFQDSFQTMQLSKIEQNFDKQENNNEQLNGVNTPFINNFKIDKGYRGLVCLNCTSYMSGITNICQTKKNLSKQGQLQFTPQKTNDGKVQFIAFENELSLALQRITRNGCKVTQGSGPYQIDFKQIKQEVQEETFIQIDGESLKVINISEIKIQKSKKFNQGKIRVLKRKCQ